MAKVPSYITGEQPAATGEDVEYASNFNFSININSREDATQANVEAAAVGMIENAIKWPEGVEIESTRVSVNLSEDNEGQYHMEEPGESAELKWKGTAEITTRQPADRSLIEATGNEAEGKDLIDSTGEIKYLSLFAG